MLDLAKSANVRAQNSVKFKLQNHHTPVVMSRLANHHNNNRSNLSDFKTIDHFLLNTIANRKCEFLIGSLCHLIS